MFRLLQWLIFCIKKTTRPWVAYKSLHDLPLLILWSQLCPARPAAAHAAPQTHQACPRLGFCSSCYPSQISFLNTHMVAPGFLQSVLNPWHRWFPSPCFTVLHSTYHLPTRYLFILWLFVVTLLHQNLSPDREGRRLFCSLPDPQNLEQFGVPGSGYSNTQCCPCFKVIS